jgi:hypothetical protein
MINGVSRLHELSELRRQEFRQTGVPSFDGMTGGLVRGGICELSGPDGSGKRGLALRMAACSTDRGGLCAVVDGTDGFDPISAQGSGLSLSKTVWVRCGGDLTKSIMSTEYLVQSRLFDLIWLDLGGFGERELAMLPSSYWYRFKVGLQGSPTSLVVTAGEPRVRSAAQQTFRLERRHSSWDGEGNFKILERIESVVECVRPFPSSVTMSFSSG